MANRFNPDKVKLALRQDIEDTGFSQAEIARLAGLTPGQVTRLLSTSNIDKIDDPKISYLARISYATGLSIDALLNKAGMANRFNSNTKPHIENAKLRVLLDLLTDNNTKIKNKDMLIDTLYNMVIMAKEN